LTVERVERGTALAEFVATFRLGFGIDVAFERPWIDWLATLGLGDGAPFRHFLARLDGEPVGTASVLLGAGVAGVYNVATAPGARRRGVGAEVTRAALAAARDEEGCAWSILHSSAMGLRVYRALGFREYCRIGVYFWMG
jgi:ribosomal protein S18 acetylase RimI-like enzyme